MVAVVVVVVVVVVREMQDVRVRVCVCVCVCTRHLVLTLCLVVSVEGPQFPATELSQLIVMLHSEPCLVVRLLFHLSKRVRVCVCVCLRARGFFPRSLESL